MAEVTEAFVRQRLGGAIFALATGSGSIQQRLLEAWDAMDVLGLGNDMLENDIRQEALTFIAARFNASPNPIKGSARNTILGLSSKQAEQLAADIFRLRSALERDHLEAIESKLAFLPGEAARTDFAAIEH